MFRNKIFATTLAVLLVAFTVLSCASPTATPVPPTATQPPPTQAVTGATPTPTQVSPTVSPTPTPAGPKITLVAADFSPVTHVYATSIEMFAELVKKYTNNQVEFKIYHTETLVKGREMLESGRKGMADLVAITMAYYPGDLPFSPTAGCLPFALDYAGIRKAMPSFMGIFDQEFKPLNLKTMWNIPLSIEWFFRKPVDPDNPNLAGMKIRTGGEPWTTAIKELGGVPVSMASSEIPMAIRTGVLDGYVTSLQTNDGWDLYKDAPYITVTAGFINFANPWAMNLEKYNSLPKNVQEAIDKAAAETQLWATDFSEKGDADLIVKAKGIATRVDVLTPAQSAAWKVKMQPVYDAFVAKFGDRANEVLSVIETANK